MLAYTHLKRAIQTGGHNSIEDAQAAMDLAILKIRRGEGVAAAASMAS
jgi:hypothetical protein